MVPSDSRISRTFDAMAEAFTAACSLQTGSRFIGPSAAATDAGYMPGSHEHDTYSDTFLSSIADGLHVCSLTGIVISVTDERNSKLPH